jgi:hypothetical protein
VGSVVLTAPPFDTNIRILTTPNAYSFYAYIDVVNATCLGEYSIGFTFNYTYLQITNITDGGLLGSMPGASTSGLTGASASNIARANLVGEIDSLANAIEFNGLYVEPITGSGHLLKVGFATTSFTPRYTRVGNYIGAFVNMIHLSVNQSEPYASNLYGNDTTNIDPLPSNVYSGYFQMYPLPPSVSISPSNAKIVIGHSQTFTSIVSNGVSPFKY